MKVPVKELFKEFKVFAFKGNMIDLAVAVVMGVAFGKVIDALVKFILMPLVSWPLNLVSETVGDYRKWELGPVLIGQFLSELVTFLLIAVAVFIAVVKLVGTLVKKAAPPPPVGIPVVKECPRCISDIPIKATRCKFCTSDLAAT
jgi:large conductance mechanosensitive channel